MIKIPSTFVSNYDKSAILMLLDKPVRKKMARNIIILKIL